MKKIKSIAVMVSLVSLFFLSSCSKADTSTSKGDVSLVYVEWDTELASTNVIAQVIQDMGYHVSLTPLDNAIMWESVAKGEADGMVAAWLPNTSGAHYEKFKDKVDNLGPNLPTARVGLVVPTYMEVDSIADLTDQAKQTIVGIEPGAGVVMATEKALEDYPNLSDWTIDTSSSGVMTVALDQAIRNKEEIIVTGWSPHWKFAKHDLKYLEDPQNSFGGQESINTIVRQGLKDEFPEVYHVLDQFQWEQEDMEEVMLQINKGEDPEVAARKWIDAHPEKVAAWKK